MVDEIKVRIDWEPDDGAASFANHLLASFDGAVYTLRFYRLLPPAQFAIDPEAARDIESVTARHVVTLVVSPTSMAKMVGALQGMLDLHPDHQQEE